MDWVFGAAVVAIVKREYEYYPNGGNPFYELIQAGPGPNKSLNSPKPGPLSPGRDCGYSLMVKLLPSKQVSSVRFRLAAPAFASPSRAGREGLTPDLPDAVSFLLTDALGLSPDRSSTALPALKQPDHLKKGGIVNCGGDLNSGTSIAIE